MANDWQLIGLILALELLFAIGVAAWTRITAMARIQGQTIWHVVVGVAGVVVISSLWIGWNAVGLLLACFSIAALPMAVEYFERVHREEKEAQRVREESVDGNSSADREE